MSDMELAELPPETIEQIRRYRYDRIVEKHEGPERWEDKLAYGEPKFLSPSQAKTAWP
jgi:hypothetical protein